MKYIEPIKLANVNLNDKDYLQTKIYSEQLTEILKSYYDSDYKGPLYIGIIGEWGSGKSTIVKTAISNFKSIKLFEYDAWKYEDDGFRRTFIKNMLDQSDICKFSSEYDEINNSLYEDYSISSNSIIERIKLSRIKDKKFDKIWHYVVALIVIIIVIVSGFIVAFNYNSILGMLFTTLGAIGFFNILYSETTYSKSKLFSPEQFYSTFKRILKKSKGKNNLVFIDNLDRCDGENLVLTLKCIRGFYLEEKEKFDEKVVFIIPLDSNSLNSAYNIEDSGHYLDKIFDSIVYLRQITVTDKIDFINQVLKEHPDIENIFPESAREVLLCSNAKTPREIIKLINDYVMEYLIFEKNKGSFFIDKEENKNYLMKSVILNKKYHRLYQLAFEDIKELVNLEKSITGPKEEFEKKYGKGCYDFLVKTSSITPINYYDFYSNQNNKPYSLPYNIEEALDLCNIESVKAYNNKPQLINHFENGIHYYINYSLWNIKIVNRFIVFLKLVDEGYFDSSDIAKVISCWDKCIFNNNLFYKEVIFNKRVGFNELISFAKNANPLNKFVEKIVEGIEAKVFSDEDEDNYNYYAEIVNNNLIKDPTEDDVKYMNNFVKEICEKGLFENEKYLEIVNTPLISYISLDNINLIISKLNYNHVDRMCCIINSLKKHNTKYDESLIYKVIDYLNNNCDNIKNYNQLISLINFVIDHNEAIDYINTLSLSFSFNEPTDSNYIDFFISKYIKNNVCNNTFKNFINSFNLDSNIDIIMKEFDRHIELMTSEFIDYYIEYINRIRIDTFKNNIHRIINLYKKYDDKIQLIISFKNRQELKYVYESINSASEKEEYILYAINTLNSFNEKVDNIFLFESDPKRFKDFLDTEYSLSNILLVLEKIEKKVSVQLSVEKICSIVNDKDNILEEEFNSLLNILKLSKVDKLQSKRIIKCLIEKVDINCLKILYETIDITDERLKNLIKEKIEVDMLQPV